MHDMRKERLWLTPARGNIKPYIGYPQSSLGADIRMQEENA